MAPPPTHLPRIEDTSLFFMGRNTYIPSKPAFFVEDHSLKGGLSVPLSIFNKGPSGLEAICLYLKDALSMRFCEIAANLNRDDRTIWDSYQSARGKSPEDVDEGASTISIPLSIFRDRSLGVLESLSEYMKDVLRMRFCTIAGLLHKNDRTIWTAYHRAKKKRAKKNNDNGQ